MDSTLFLIVLLFCVLVLAGLGYVLMSPSTYKGINKTINENEDEQVKDHNNNNNNRGRGLSRMNVKNRRNQQQTQQSQTQIINNIQNDSDDSDQSGDSEDDNINQTSSSSGITKKMGTKKMEKLRKKEERKRNNEAIQHMREEAKKKTEEDEKIQKQRKAEELEKERLQKEEEERIRLEEERKETEAYNLLKGNISLEESGESNLNEEQEKSLLQSFINHLKNHKMILLEDVAMEFNLKTQEVVERIKTLDKQGMISGVIDDRGKFIYISKDELESVAKFVNKKGRVNIEQIAFESNKLIDLNSKVVDDSSTNTTPTTEINQ